MKQTTTTTVRYIKTTTYSTEVDKKKHTFVCTHKHSLNGMENTIRSKKNIYHEGGKTFGWDALFKN